MPNSLFRNHLITKRKRMSDQFVFTFCFTQLKTSLKLYNRQEGYKIKSKHERIGVVTGLFPAQFNALQL